MSIAQDTGDPVAVGVRRTHLGWLHHNFQYRPSNRLSNIGDVPGRSPTPGSGGSTHGSEAGVGTPSSLNRPAPPSSAVSTHGPSVVTAMLCSKCADHVPSPVLTVHPSLRITVSAAPMLIIGSTARTSPGTSLGPRALVR